MRTLVPVRSYHVMTLFTFIFIFLSLYPYLWWTCRERTPAGFAATSGLYRSITVHSDSMFTTLLPVQCSMPKLQPGLGANTWLAAAP